MTIEDFEKLKNGVSLIENKLQLGNRPLVFLYSWDGLIITCCKKTPHHIFKWTKSSFKDLSIYEPPKKKVKLYLYCNDLGHVSERFYTDELTHFSDTGALTKVSDANHSPVKGWIKTNTFIEVIDQR